MSTAIECRLETVESELAQLRQLVEQAIGVPANSSPLNGSLINRLSSEREHKPAVEHPLTPLAGRLRNHPLLDSWREAIEQNRHKMDEQEGLP